MCLHIEMPTGKTVHQVSFRKEVNIFRLVFVLFLDVIPEIASNIKK